MFCDFRHALGIPSQGVHAYRLFNIAIVDTLLMLIGAYFIAKVSGVSYVKSVISLFLLGIFLHWLFCVPTRINMALGLI